MKWILSFFALCLSQLLLAISFHGILSIYLSLFPFSLEINAFKRTKKKCFLLPRPRPVFCCFFFSSFRHYAALCVCECVSSLILCSHYYLVPVGIIVIMNNDHNLICVSNMKRKKEKSVLFINVHE